MPKCNLKLVVGFITYGDLTAKYLPHFLPSLKAQVFKDLKIIAVDNTPEKNNDNIKYLKADYPEIEILEPGKNIGFAKAYNLMIKRAIGYGARYILMLNPDMILEVDAFDKLVSEMDKDKSLGSASPKVLRWDYRSDKKTSLIDTCGIILKPGLRFVDLGQSQFDKGQFRQMEILGPSGAAAIYRLSALEKVGFNGQYFDELMFMYKEDCDLAYRLFLANFKSKCIGQAVMHHDRTAAGKGESDIEVAINRKNKGRQVKKWSFLNQQIIFIKYWYLQNFLSKLAIIWLEVKMVIFALLFEQYLLREFAILMKIKSKIKIYK